MRKMGALSNCQTELSTPNSITIAPKLLISEEANRERNDEDRWQYNFKRPILFARQIDNSTVALDVPSEWLRSLLQRGRDRRFQEWIYKGRFVGYCSVADGNKVSRYPW